MMLTMRLPEYEFGGLSSQYGPSCASYSSYPEVIAMQSQYRDPPPYPGHSKQLQSQPGLRQSFSGSEASTDVSVSSTENLAMSQRQDPQGEETQQTQQHVYNQLELANAASGNYSILARLGMPTTTAELKPETSTAVPTYFITGPAQSDTSPGYPQDHQLKVPQWNPQAVAPRGTTSSLSRTPVQYNQNLISSYRTIPTYVNSQWSPQASVDQTQSGGQLVSYLANLPPPPEYPGPKGPVMVERKPSDAMDKIELTKSQPDLSRLSDPQQKVSIQGFASDPKFSAMAMCDDPRMEEVDHMAIATRMTQMVEMLSEENRRLRDELETNYKKVSKLLKFEFEIQKVHEAYESLVKSSEKRERLEAVMKKRLEDQLKNVKSENFELKEKVEALQKSHMKSLSLETEKEGTIGKLLAQNKELLCITERTRKCSLEEKQTVEVGKVEQLQKSFVSLQSASERRENMERQLRSKLEKELDFLRTQQKMGWKQGSEHDPEKVNVEILERLLIEKDSKILALQAEIAKWEQRYLEESTLRQLVMEDNAGSKDIRLAALEKSSADTEKLIDEAKSEKLQHMEELYQANRRVAELESRVKCLLSQVSEKEAMVKVFQRSPMARSSSVHTIYCSPLHSPRPSVISTATLSRQGSQSDSYFPTIKHVKAGSASAIDSRSVEEELREKFKDLQTESKDDSDEEGRLLLWQV